MRMEAYYYIFNRTHSVHINKILSAVACAGKSYHHTDMWADEEWPDDDCWSGEGHSGRSCEEMIQNAANEAAEMQAKLQSAVCDILNGWGPDDPCEHNMYNSLKEVADELGWYYG